MYHIFCIHSSVLWHLGWFCILAIWVIPWWTWGCSYLLYTLIPPPCKYTQKWDGWITDPMVALFLPFKGNSILFSRMTVPIFIPTNSTQWFPFLYIFANTYLLITVILTGVGHLTVILAGISLMISEVGQLFIYILATWMCKHVYSGPLNFYNRGVCISAVELY